MIINGISCRRGHAGSHIHGILQSEIHDLPNSKPCNHGSVMFTFYTAYNKSAASRHRPGGRERSLVAIGKRKAEFLFRTGKMTGGHTGRILCHSSGDHDCRCREGKSTGGAGPIHSHQRYLKRAKPKVAGNALTKKVACKQKSNIFIHKSRFSDGKLKSLLLQSTLRLFPGITAELIVHSHHIKQISKGSLTFFASDHTGTCPYINRYRYFNTLLSLLKNCPIITVHKKPPDEFTFG